MLITLPQKARVIRTNRWEIMIRLVLMTLIAVNNPALAAPPQIEDFCWAQAAQIRFNGRGEREHFIANCIADFTPTPPAKRRFYKKPRY